MKNKRKGSFLADRQFAIKRLESKIKDAQEFLKDRLEGLLQLRRDRTEAFTPYEQKIKKATVRCRDAQQGRDALNLEANQLEADAEKMLQRVELLRAEAIGTLVELRAVDVASAKDNYREIKQIWRVKMRAQLDGRTRRKRGELARFQARLEKREAATKKLVDGTAPSAAEIMYGEKGTLPAGTGNEDLGRTRLQIDTKKPVIADPVSNEVK